MHRVVLNGATRAVVNCWEAVPVAGASSHSLPLMGAQELPAFLGECLNPIRPDSEE
jgi:hypothetical protein